MDKIPIVVVKIGYSGHHPFALLAIDEATQSCVTRVVNCGFGSQQCESQ